MRRLIGLAGMVAIAAMAQTATVNGVSGQSVAWAAAYKPTFASGGTTTCDLSKSNVCEVDFGTGNTTLAFSNPAYGVYKLRSVEDSVGGRTYTAFPGSARGFSQPGIGTGANDVVEQDFTWDGTYYNAEPAMCVTCTWQGSVSAESGACPTAVSGYDILCADSTLHAAKISNNGGTYFRAAQTVASGSGLALGTTVIASGACATVVTATATGAATTDVVSWSPSADWSAITGYSGTAGVVTVYGYAAANTANFKMCNWTGSSITPSAASVNWRIAR